MPDPMERPAVLVTCSYAAASGEGLPLSAVKAPPEGAERRRSNQAANTPPLPPHRAKRRERALAAVTPVALTEGARP